MKKQTKKILVPLVVLVAGLSLTIVAWRITTLSIADQLELRFGAKITEITSLIGRRMDLYADVLPGLQGLFAASENVTEDEWYTYIDELNILQNYSGITGLSYIKKVTASEVPDYPYTIYPASKKEVYYPYTYRYTTISGTQSTIGFDISSEEKRNETITEAGMTGHAVASPVVLGITTGLPTFSIYAPLYTSGMPVETEGERTDALRGFISAGFRVKELFNTLATDPAFSDDIDLEIYDSPTFDEVTPDTLLYDSGVESIDQARTKKGVMTEETHIVVGGRTWTLRFSALPSYDLHTIERITPVIILVGGTLLTLLMSWLLFLFASAQAKAMRIAEKMTKDLEKSRTLLRLSMENAGDMIFITDITGRILDANSAASATLGYTHDEFLRMNATELTPDIDQKELVAMGEELRKNKTLTLERIERKKDGTLFPVEARTTLFGSEDDLRTISIVRDIGERKEAEKKIKERSDELERLNALMVGRELKMAELKKELGKKGDVS